MRPGWKKCGAYGFSTPPPDPPTVDRLRAVLVGEAATADRNPIDLTLANLRSETYRDTIAALVESPTYDAIVVVVGSSGLGDPKLAAEPVGRTLISNQQLAPEKTFTPKSSVVVNKPLETTVSGLVNGGLDGTPPL